MVNLDVRPTVEPSLHTWPTHDGPCPPESRGPEWVDAETVEQLGRQIDAGLLTLPPHASSAVERASEEALNELFAAKLASSPLSARTALPHRTYALAMAIRELADAAALGTVQGVAVGVPESQLGVMIVNVEGYMAAMRIDFDRFAPAGFPPELVDAAVQHTAMLTPELVEKLTGLRLQQLAAMRSAGVGPAFVKLPRTRASIRYPLVGLLGWLYGGAK